MTDKFKRASDYKPEFTVLVKRTCLEIATRMGDYMQNVVIVGGLVPSLIINNDNYPEPNDMYVGTTDLDMGFHLAILDGKRILK